MTTALICQIKVAVFWLVKCSEITSDEHRATGKRKIESEKGFLGELNNDNV